MGFPRWFLFCMLLAQLALLPAPAATVIGGTDARGRLVRRSTGSAALHLQNTWNTCLSASIHSIERHGAGGYSIDDRAHDALARAFYWDSARNRPAFNPAAPRPSFCSGAVYAVILDSLIRWDTSKRLLTEEVWNALKPRTITDGVSPWGYANANGPGFALLIHELRAGINFTEIEKARPGDVMKIWWNDKIGAGERGHLVIVLARDAKSVTFWSSNMPRDGAADGYGHKTIPLHTIKRALFTRITHPENFARAPRIQQNDWLTSLTVKNVTWEECCRRCGIAPGRSFSVSP